jgi:hypothetical protein
MLPIAPSIYYERTARRRTPGAEDGLAQLTKIVVRKPYPSVERLRNMQRVMTIGDPKAAEVNVSALLDDSFVKKADDRASLIALRQVASDIRRCLGCDQSVRG